MKHTCNPFRGSLACKACEFGEPPPASPYAGILKDVDKGPEGLASVLRSWANEIAQRYGHPVDLVGSALVAGFAARDVDVVCILPLDEYSGRFLRHQGREGYARLQAELGKLSAYAARHIGVNVDLKVQPDVQAAEHAGKDRRRLDTLPFDDVPPVTVV